MLLLGSGAAAVPAAGQDAPELLTLERAIDLATSGNRLAKIAALDETKAAAAGSALHAQRWPKLDFKVLEGGFVTPFALSFKQGAFGTYPATGPIPFTDLHVSAPRSLATGIVFTAVQPLTQLRKITMGEKLFALEHDLDAEKTREQRQSVVADVKRAYYALLQTRAGQVAVAQALTQLEELERVVGQYLERQVVLESDLLAVRTERARAEQTRLTLRNQEQTLKERLNELMGRPLTTAFEVGALPDLPAADTDVEAAVASARRARPALRQAELNVQRAEQDLALQKQDRLPDLSLVFGHLSLLNVDVLPTNVSGVAAVFSWEPFDWGRRNEETAQRAATLEQARLARDEAAAQIELDVRAKARRLGEARELLRVDGLARETAAERLRVATERYRTESSLLRDVLEAQTVLARATQEYQQALGAFWTARADFEQAIGDQP